MGRPRNQLPTYRRHKQSGNAVITIYTTAGRRRDVLLGRHGSAASKQEYRRICAELETGPAAEASVGTTKENHSDITVAEVFLLFTRHAKAYYRKPDGSEGGEVSRFAASLRPVRELYDHTLAREFGPLALKTVRHRMIGKLCRRIVNQRVGRVKAVFKWAASEELIPATVFHALQTVAGLRKGKSAAKDHPRVKPVDDALVEATLPHCSRPMAAMLRVLRHTGMRPGELTIMRPCDLDTTGPVWKFIPATHKNDYRDQGRMIYIGPRGQMILKHYLADTAPEEYVFSPIRERTKRFAEMRTARKTRVQPSQHNRSKARPTLRPGDRYEVTALCRAVHKACNKAGHSRWFPYQLRHTFATEVRRLHGVDVVRTLLGHATAHMAEVYAEKDHGKAAETAKLVG